MFFAAIFLIFFLIFAKTGLWLWSMDSMLATAAALVFFWAALCEAVTMSYYLLASLAGINPGVFFKRPGGRMKLAPAFLAWPYLSFEAWLARRYRGKRKEPLFEQAAPGLWQGSRPSARDWERLEAGGITAVLDLVAEFPDPARVMINPEIEYVCVPTLDGTAPTLAELEAGARFVDQARQAGRSVLVHCTFGHGRSSTFTAAALLLSGEASDLHQAIALLKKMKRTIWLTRDQMKVLRRFAKKHAS